MSHPLNRRSFLKISSATILGSVAATTGLSSLRQVHAGPEAHGPDDRVVPTFCELCFWKCGVLASVRDGVVYKLEGNPLHPLSNGKLCPRGTGGVGALYDEDRLRRPLIRTRVGTEEKWREVSWDEALDFTAKRLQEVKAQHGAQSIALFSHGHGGGFFKTLLKGLGSTNIVAPSNDQCRGPRESGFELTFGAAVGSVETLSLIHS